MKHIWFRFKKGDLFKPKNYVPIISNLQDLEHYKFTKFSSIEIILDRRQLSTEDIATIYTWLNGNNRIDSSNKKIDIYSVKSDNNIAILQASGCGLEIKIWVNYLNCNFKEYIWSSVLKSLFDNIPKELFVLENENDILKLADLKGDVILRTLPKNDSFLDIDVISQNVVTNIVTRELIIMGDHRLGSESQTIYRYNLNVHGGWLAVSDKRTPKDVTLYTCGSVDNTFCWDNYIGVNIRGY